ncbi:MAG: hypothetical protein JWM16_5529, partial [Verrucomicrobiales bacterium]|nr:hypothetical protein [Verrucomicrobiales bacterium]
PIRACSAVIPDFCKFRNCFSDTCTANADLKCTQSPAAGTPVGPGSYIITITITDTDGNTSQCQVQFDVIAPTDTRVWHTGVSGAQAANFVVVQTPSGPVNTPSVLTTVPSAWLANDATSKWVSFISNSGNAAPGVYIYRLKFTLPCVKGASITGRFMSDDAARIYLNGVPTAALSTSFNTWAPVNLTSGFVPGVNTLDIYVTNAIIWTGIRTELTNNFNCCCPEALAIRCPGSQSGWVCGTANSAQVPYTVSAFSQCPSSNITVTVVCVPPAPGPFPLGTTTVNCTATDSLGNKVTCSFPVKVVRDTTPPVITCPGPITIATCSNKVPAYYKATAKDDCSPTVTISCVPSSGTLFNAGTTTIVTCTATDACGNKSTCSFPVKVINNLLWQTLPAGIADCYSLAGSEPATPGACLMSAYPGVYWKPFDNPAVDRSVGYTWNFPVSWNILAANLATRARPPLNGCDGNSMNDSIQLGLTNCATPGWLWARYFGSGNLSPGLVESMWCNGSGCAFNFNFDLAALPPVSGPPINLLPHMNSVKRLDYFSQDDTTVDYADLRVLRCAPQSVFGGFEATMNNAKLVRGPVGNWCIIRDDIKLPTWTAQVTLGSAEAVAQPMRYRCKPSAWDLKSSTKARFASGEEGPFAGFSLSHESNSPIAELRLTDIPPGVKEVQVLLLEDGSPISWDTFPADPSIVLQTFSDSTEYHGVLFTRGEGFFDLARAVGEPGNQVCVRFLPEPEAVSFTSLEIEGTGIDEFDVAEPQLRTASKTSAITLTGEGIGLALDGQASISPLDPDSGGPIGLRWRRPQGLGSQGQDGVSFMATNELTAYVQTVLKGTPVDTNKPRVTFTATATFSDMTSRVIPGITFTGSLYGFGASAMIDGASRPIHRVQVWSNATLVVDVPNPVSVECRDLPPIYRIGSSPWYVDADICHRFPFYNRSVVRIDGHEYECSELRLNVSSDAPAGEVVEGIAGLDIDASGIDALVLSRVIEGTVPVRFHPPIRFTVDDGTGVSSEQILIGWDQPWPALEGASGVLGPWIQLPTDGTQITVPVNGAGNKFFRLRE